jgi:hypothetical protein
MTWLYMSAFHRDSTSGSVKWQLNLTPRWTVHKSFVWKQPETALESWLCVQFNAYISMRTFQCVHFNAYISMRTFQCIHFNAYISMRTFQCAHFNAYTSMRTFQCVHFNAYISMHTFQCVHFNAYIKKYVKPMFKYRLLPIFFRTFFHGLVILRGFLHKI